MGYKPTTSGLQGVCSTAVLQPQPLVLATDIVLSHSFFSNWPWRGFCGCHPAASSSDSWSRRRQFLSSSSTWRRSENNGIESGRKVGPILGRNLQTCEPNSCGGLAKNIHFLLIIELHENKIYHQFLFCLKYHIMSASREKIIKLSLLVSFITSKCVCR